MVHFFLESLLNSGLVATDDSITRTSPALENMLDMMKSKAYTWPKDVPMEGGDANKYDNSEHSILQIMAVLSDRSALYKTAISELLGNLFQHQYFP